MRFDFNKSTLTLKAPNLGGFQNLNMSSLFLLGLVKDEIDIERYERIIKTNCYNYWALHFHESKN